MAKTEKHGHVAFVRKVREKKRSFITRKPFVHRCLIYYLAIAEYILYYRYYSTLKRNIHTNTEERIEWLEKSGRERERAKKKMLWSFIFCTYAMKCGWVYANISFFGCCFFSSSAGRLHKMQMVSLSLSLLECDMRIETHWRRRRRKKKRRETS